MIAVTFRPRWLEQPVAFTHLHHLLEARGPFQPPAPLASLPLPFHLLHVLFLNRSHFFQAFNKPFEQALFESHHATVNSHESMSLTRLVRRFNDSLVLYEQMRNQI